MEPIPEDVYRALSDGPMIIHYGTPRHSGRYPWGSGGDDSSSQRNSSLLDAVNEMKKQGLSEKDIAKGLGMDTTTQLRDLKTIARNEKKQNEIHMAQQLKAKGMSNVAIAKQMTNALGYSIGDTQVGALLKPSQDRKAAVLDNVTDTLRKAVDEKGYLDVGSGVEYQLDVSPTKLRSSLQKLKDEGYLVHRVKVEQLGTGQQTNMRVLTKPGTTWSDAQKNRDQIQQLTDYSDDGGLTSLGIHPPLSISSKRVGIKYADQGGSDADGVIYVRPGVKDIELGRDHYAQVRIMIDDTHYLKGMAVYKDDLPEGTDLLFNTNKKDTGNKLDAMKELKKNPDGSVDQDNPFGATIRQIGERDALGKVTKVTSAMNLVNEAGDWDRWSKNLPSQMLSKQKPVLAKEQLELAYTKKKAELESILALTNPTVKQHLLEKFADGSDSAAVHLKAAALPRQKTQVLLPVPQMKEGEVYAPNFRDGENVALIRFPHGGTFEIPELKVNNRTPAAKKLLGDTKDAIGIHPKVAERLSGADFDGDTVLVIPNNLGKVKSSPALEGLKGFEPKESYPPYEGMKRMTAHEKGLEMGKISNLITDMTIGGAKTDEIARAVRHSMVVIDAEKHNLDFRRSAVDNGIAALKKKYQGGSASGGAATLISRAKSRQDILDRKERPASKGGSIDPKTGRKIYEETGKSRIYVDGKGGQREVPTKIQSTKLAEATDAHILSSGTVIEKIYADHSNRLKGLANQARLKSLGLKPRPYSPSAKQAHIHDVATLDAKLTLAKKNAPRERQAQVFANHTVKLKLQANPDLKLKENAAELKKIKAQALAAARLRTEADKHNLDLTQEEWNAIQAGAITTSKLKDILNYADLDKIKALATPREKKSLSTTNVARAKSMHSRGYTWAEIADALGVSVSVVQKTVSEEGD